jgi:hypothetical protein
VREDGRIDGDYTRGPLNPNVKENMEPSQETPKLKSAAGEEVGKKVSEGEDREDDGGRRKWPESL